MEKRFVLLDLRNWFNLNVRHYPDVMHVDKNVFDSLIGALLNIQGKIKDGKNICH